MKRSYSLVKKGFPEQHRTKKIQINAGENQLMGPNKPDKCLSLHRHNAADSSRKSFRAILLLSLSRSSIYFRSAGTTITNLSAFSQQQSAACWASPCRCRWPRPSPPARSSPRPEVYPESAWNKKKSIFIALFTVLNEIDLFAKHNKRGGRCRDVLTAYFFTAHGGTRTTVQCLSILKYVARQHERKATAVPLFFLTFNRQW